MVTTQTGNTISKLKKTTCMVTAQTGNTISKLKKTTHGNNTNR